MSIDGVSLVRHNVSTEIRTRTARNQTNKECHFGVVIHDAFLFTFLHRPRGPMDKASDFESEDCGFDPHRGQFSGKCIFYSNHIGSYGSPEQQNEVVAQETNERSLQIALADCGKRRCE